MFSCEFGEMFNNILFPEHLRANASDWKLGYFRRLFETKYSRKDQVKFVEDSL